MTRARLAPGRENIIAEARAWIGTPYHHQAALKGIGCACLGLVRGVWRAVHGADPEHPPAYSRDWAETLREETLADAAGRHMIPLALDAFDPGDLLLFAINDNAPARHCAILVAQEASFTCWHHHAGLSRLGRPVARSVDRRRRRLG